MRDKPNLLRSSPWWSFAAVSLLALQISGADGADAFQRGTCNACHTIGGGRLVGPDLDGITEKRTQDWLFRFIKSSQAMIDAGDEDAIAVFEEYSRMPMPDAPLSDDEIQAVLSYIAAESTTSKPDEPAAADPIQTEEQPAVTDQPPSPEAIALGQGLFQGTVRFENGGATCNACHDIADDAVIGGGILARELTDVFPRMGGAGVSAILGRPPFPVMEAAYADQPLTEGEINALVAFLAHVGATSDTRMPRDYGLGLFASGVVGAGVIFGSCSLVWRRRKKGSVNQAIYDRQISSRS